MSNPENLDLVKSEDRYRHMPADENVRLVWMSGRAADAVARHVGMAVRGRPIRIRASWVEFAVVPAFIRPWLGNSPPVDYPVLVEVTDRGLVFAHDPQGVLVWTPDDALEEEDVERFVSGLAAGWRQTLVPWTNILSITADLDTDTGLSDLKSRLRNKD